MRSDCRSECACRINAVLVRDDFLERRTRIETNRRIHNTPNMEANSSFAVTKDVLRLNQGSDCQVRNVQRSLEQGVHVRERERQKSNRHKASQKRERDSRSRVSLRASPPANPPQAQFQRGYLHTYLGSTTGNASWTRRNSKLTGGDFN